MKSGSNLLKFAVTPFGHWRKAWSENPDERPSPAQIVEDLKKIQAKFH